MNFRGFNSFYSHIFKVKKGKVILIGISVILIVGFLLISNNSSTKGETSRVLTSINHEIQAENEKKLKEAEEIQNLLYQEDGFFEQVHNDLEEKGYAFQLLFAVYSKDDIQVKLLLENKEATKTVQ